MKESPHPEHDAASRYAYRHRIADALCSVSPADWNDILEEHTYKTYRAGLQQGKRMLSEIVFGKPGVRGLLGDILLRVQEEEEKEEDQITRIDELILLSQWRALTPDEKVEFQCLQEQEQT